MILGTGYIPCFWVLGPLGKAHEPYTRTLVAATMASLYGILCPPFRMATLSIALTVAALVLLSRVGYNPCIDGPKRAVGY